MEPFNYNKKTLKRLMMNTKNTQLLFDIPSSGFYLWLPVKILFLSLFISAHLSAQPEFLTYENAMNIALTNNIAIKQQQNNIIVSKAEKQQSMANFIPGINAYGAGYRTDGRQWSNGGSALVNTTIDRANYSIGADMTVFNGFKNIYRLKQSNNLLIAEKELLEQSKQDVIYLVSKQFIQILLDTELVLIAEEDVSVQEKIYNQIGVYVKTGAKTKTELLSQQAQLKTSEVNLLSWQNQLRQDKANLAKTLLFNNEKEFELLKPDWNIDSILNAEYNIDSLYQIAVQSRPELKMLKAEELADKNDIAISRSGVFPRISIYYNYGSEYASDNRRMNPADSLYQRISINDQLLKDNYSHQYGFNISVPIFNRLQNRTNVVRSRIAYENSKMEYHDFEMQLFIDIQNAYHNFLSQKKTYLANRIRAEASKLTYERQQEMYRLGQGNIIDLNIENKRKIEAQSEEAQAKYNLVFQQIVLDYFIGAL